MMENGTGQDPPGRREQQGLEGTAARRRRDSYLDRSSRASWAPTTSLMASTTVLASVDGVRESVWVRAPVAVRPRGLRDSDVPLQLGAWEVEDVVLEVVKWRRRSDLRWSSTRAFLTLDTQFAVAHSTIKMAREERLAGPYGGIEIGKN